MTSQNVTLLHTKPPVEKIDNTELIEIFKAEGGRILHIRPHGEQRGLTYAYIKKGSRIEVSTSVQHRNDTFTKKLGTRTAIEHFHEGKTIFLPINRDTDVVQSLKVLAFYLSL